MASRRLALVRFGLATTALVASLTLAQALGAIPEGLQATYFPTVDWTTQPAFTRIEPQPSTDNLVLAWGRSPAPFSVVWTGSFIVLQNETITFATRSDDGSWLYVDDYLVVDNGGNHAARTVAAPFKLRAGVHRIRIKYFQSAGQLAFDLLWARGDRPLDLVPSWALAPGRPALWRFAADVSLNWLLVAAEWTWVAWVLTMLAAAIPGTWRRIARFSTLLQDAARSNGLSGAISAIQALRRRTSDAAITTGSLAGVLGRRGTRSDSTDRRPHAEHVARARTWAYIVALVAVSVVSRLPQLRSPNLLVDGDEAVVGLMAKHLALGREFPIFFYGQHYGFSSIEAMAGALSFLLFGTNAVSLKLAMLALWTLGILFLFLAQARLVGVNRSFWITAVFLLTPAWAVWSMKARGGYLTSFTATAALLWLLVQDREHETPMRWLVAGALTFLIYLAQPLWLPGVLPIVIVVLLSRRSLLCTVSYFAVPIVMALFIRTSAGGITIGNPDVLGSLPSLGRQIYVNLTGTYYLARNVDPGPITAILAVLWCGILPAAVLLQLYRLLTARYCLWSHLLFLSVCATLVSEMVLLEARDARYLLPLSGLLIMLAAIEFIDLVDRRLVSKRMAYGLTLTVLLLGSASMREFRDFTYLWRNVPTSLSENERLQQVIAYLKAEGVRHVFSMNGLLDSQLIFYSDEKVVSRWAMGRDRYLPYVDEVDRALADGEAVAVVGYTNTSGAPGCWDIPICTGGIEGLVKNPEAIVTIDGRYFVYVKPTKELLQQLEFRFQD